MLRPLLDVLPDELVGASVGALDGAFDGTLVVEVQPSPTEQTSLDIVTRLIESVVPRFKEYSMPRFHFRKQLFLCPETG